MLCYSLKLKWLRPPLHFLHVNPFQNSQSRMTGIRSQPMGKGQNHHLRQNKIQVHVLSQYACYSALVRSQIKNKALFCCSSHGLFLYDPELFSNTPLSMLSSLCFIFITQSPIWAACDCGAIHWNMVDLPGPCP